MIFKKIKIINNKKKVKINDYKKIFYFIKYSSFYRLKYCCGVVVILDMNVMELKYCFGVVVILDINVEEILENH